MAKKTRFCINGHDTLVCGRDKWRKCKRCKNIKRHEERMNDPLKKFKKQVLDRIYKNEKKLGRR